MAISSAQQTEILKVVIGLFNAAPGGNNLTDLANAVDNGMTIPQLADVLAAHPLFTQGVMGGHVTTASQVGELLSHFGLVAGGAPGSADAVAEEFFTARIESGAGFGSIIYEAVTYLSGSPSAEFASVATLLNNKAMVAEAFSASYSNNDLGVLQGVLANVTGTAAYTDADVTAYLDTAGYPVDGSAFVLTNGTDVATANIFTAGLVYTPGGDDRINALQDEDVLTGTGTNPTLNATIGNANDNGATIITPTLNNIETLNAAFTGSGFGAVTDLDMQDATGLHSVNITRVSQAVNAAEIGNIQDATVNDLSVANTNANEAGVVEFSYGTGVLAGDNTVALGIDNVQIGALNIGQNTSGIGFRGVGTEGYEHMTLNSTGGSNTIGTLNMPMDTDTAGNLTITGDSDLRLGGLNDAVNTANNALVEVQDLYTAGSGVALAGSRIATIDASAFTGNLTLVLDNILDVGKAGTSGVDQDVTVTGGAGNDTFVLYDAVQAADTINGGAGDDTLLFYSGSSLDSVALGIENASIFADGSIGPIAVDFDNLTDVTHVTVRNISSDVDVPGFGGDGVLENAADAPVVVTLTDLSATQATGITLQHATTGNNQIQNTTITAAVKTNTASDTLGVTLEDGNNTDPRSNSTWVTAIAGNPSTIENITLTDSDTESNSVELTNFATHTGTITLTGGEAGDFINLDVDTAGADISAVLNGGDSILGPTLDTTILPGEVQQGLYGLDTDGTAVDRTAGHIFDVGGLATQVRLGAATIDASAEIANVILRVSTNAASASGAQTILTGTGDDTVIFDRLNDTRAGLTISDTVTGGDGNDTLAIDGNGVRISLGASEWTNVSGFENLRIVGTSAAPVGTLLGQNAYNLALTNDLISTNGSGLLNIVNDNDANNDQSGTAALFYLDTANTGVESGVTIDARSLNAQNHFTYNGEEGASRTIDRFMFTDANINGGNTIDGGAVDNLSDTNSPANADIMEVRNTATVTVGDLAGVSNIGIIAGVNDQAVTQNLDLELNDTVIDALVDSYHAAAAGAANMETVTVRVNNAGDIAAPVANMGLSLDASALTTKVAVNVLLDQSGGFGAADSIQLSPSGGVVTLDTFVTAGNAAGYTFSVAGEDEIVLSLSKFALSASVAGGPLAAGDFTSSAVLVNPATDVSANEIVFDQTNGNVFYNLDGATAGGLVQIATLTGVTDLAVADFSIIA